MYNAETIKSLMSGWTIQNKRALLFKMEKNGIDQGGILPTSEENKILYQYLLGECVKDRGLFVVNNIEFEQIGECAKYPIGYKFTWKQGKRSPKECTIVDYAIMHNAAGDLVKLEYVIEYFFALNNAVVRQTIPRTSIDIATDNGYKRLV